MTATMPRIESLALSEAERHVLARIAEAMDTWSRDTTPTGPAGYRSNWPEMLRDIADVFANATSNDGQYEAMRAKPGAPNGAAIDRAVEVQQWLVWMRESLGPRRVQFICALAARRPCHWLEGRFRRSRTQLYRWRKEVLAYVVLRLTVEGCEKKVVDRTEQMEQISAFKPS